MINAQQIVILMPLFNLNLPQNAKMVFGWLMQIAAMEALPTDWIYSFVTDVEGRPVTPVFEDLGFEHHLILNNFGTMGFVFAMLPFVYLIIFVASYCRACRCCRRCTKRARNYLYWSILLRLTIEGYVIGLICSLINMINLDLSRETDNWTFGNSVITLVIFPMLILFPIYCIWFMNKYRLSLNTDSMKKRYGEMTAGY